MSKKIKFLLILASLPIFAMAQNNEFTAKDIFFSVGNYSQFVREIQTNNSGKLNNYQFAPAISAGVEFALPWKELLVPLEVGWVLPRNVETGQVIYEPFRNDASVTKNIWALRLGLKYPLKRFHFKVGVSNIFTMINGKGGTTTLNNGGSTSTFYVPNQSRTAVNNTLDFGVEYFFNKKWAARADVLIFSLLTKESRQYSYLVSLNYYWENPFSSKGETP